MTGRSFMRSLSTTVSRGRRCSSPKNAGLDRKGKLTRYRCAPRRV